MYTISGARQCAAQIAQGSSYGSAEADASVNDSSESTPFRQPKARGTVKGPEIPDGARAFDKQVHAKNAALAQKQAGVVARCVSHLNHVLNPVIAALA